MTQTEALRLALEALEYASTGNRRPEIIGPAITAIKAALEARDEPVAIYGYCPVCGAKGTSRERHPDGNTTCVNGHKYKSRDTLSAPPQQEAKNEPVAVDGNTSDGYHTFNELYEFRKAYNVALFNEWASSNKCFVHKSWRHNDGELCFGGGWFIVVAVLPQGQISNHYEAKDWGLFSVPETERALFEFDGHTGSDVVERLKSYAPLQRKPLTLEQLREHWKVAKVLDMTDAEIDFADYVLIARDVEALHGIKGEA